jgi:hypothetical protein
MAAPENFYRGCPFMPMGQHGLPPMCLLTGRKKKEKKKEADRLSLAKDPEVFTSLLSVP